MEEGECARDASVIRLIDFGRSMAGDGDGEEGCGIVNGDTDEISVTIGSCFDEAEEGRNGDLGRDVDMLKCRYRESTKQVIFFNNIATLIYCNRHCHL